MEGLKYNRLTVIKDLGLVLARNGKRQVHKVEVLCNCGSVREVALCDIKNGHTKSCGCYIKEITSNRSKTHGGTHTPIYNLWVGVNRRCKDTKFNNYKHYGGRGIIICKEWETDFLVFKDWCLENGYKKGLQLDRENNDGNYEPNNCRFVTPKVNSNNRRNTQYLTLNGETKTISYWAEITGLGKETIRRRINKYNWSDERALTVKDGRK